MHTDPCRCEMQNPQVSLRFGLILEAYLRGAPNHTTEINRQVTTHSLLYIHTHTFCQIRPMSTELPQYSLVAEHLVSKAECRGFESHLRQPIFL